MEQFLIRSGVASAQSKPTGWVYRRPDVQGISELGRLDGSQGLAAHFHNELQISFVLKGRRAFRTRDGGLVLSAGQCACIPAGLPHQSLPGSCDLASFNAYAPAGDYALAALTREIEDFWRQTGHFELSDLAELIRKHRQSGIGPQIGKANPIHPESRDSIGTLAKRSGKSRESFSRSFAALYGMPPHAFRTAARLNYARDLLRKGEAVAAVAVEAGFADQSHLGRCFRRAFGITPGRYRLG